MKSHFLNQLLTDSIIAKNYVVYRNKNFNYTFISKGGIYCVFLFDEDDGQISLTNAMEEVISEVVTELIRSQQIPMGLSIDKLRFFAYGTDEVWCEPKVTLTKITKGNISSSFSKISVECIIGGFESVDDTDDSWHLVFLLG